MHTTRVCDAPGCTIEAYAFCGHCDDVMYCGDSCAKDHWDTGHKYVKGHIERSNVHLQLTLQRLWIEHVDYTHNVIVAIARDLSFDLKPYVARLLKNQKELADVIGGGDEPLHQLLSEHITVAGDILTAIRKGADALDLIASWRRNGNQIADRLNELTGPGLTRHVLRTAFKTHLDQTLKEATLVFQNDMTQAIKVYDKARQHMINVAALLAENI